MIRGIGGILTLIGSFIVMPFKTLKITEDELERISQKGIDIGETNIPHLTWLGIASHTIISIGIVISLAYGIVMGLISLIKFDMLKFFLFPLLGVLGAIVIDWVIGISLELMLLWVGIANDIKQLKK